MRETTGQLTRYPRRTAHCLYHCQSGVSRTVPISSGTAPCGGRCSPSHDHSAPSPLLPPHPPESRLVRGYAMAPRPWRSHVPTCDVSQILDRPHSNATHTRGLRSGSFVLGQEEHVLFCSCAARPRHKQSRHAQRCRFVTPLSSDTASISDGRGPAGVTGARRGRGSQPFQRARHARWNIRMTLF